MPTTSQDRPSQRYAPTIAQTSKRSLCSIQSSKTSVSSARRVSNRKPKWIKVSKNQCSNLTAKLLQTLHCKYQTRRWTISPWNLPPSWPQRKRQESRSRQVEAHIRMSQRRTTARLRILPLKINSSRYYRAYHFWRKSQINNKYSELPIQLYQCWNKYKNTTTSVSILNRNKAW